MKKYEELLKLDRFTIIQVVAIILIVLGSYLAFSPPGIVETGYGELLNKTSFLRSLGELERIKIASVLAIMLSTLLVYFSLAKITNNKTASFLATVFFTFSPVLFLNLVFFSSFSIIITLLLFSFSLASFAFMENNGKYLAIVFLLAGFALAYQTLDFPEINQENALTVLLAGLGNSGFILPLALVSLAFPEFRKKENLLLLIIGALSTIYLPSFSIVSFAYLSAFGLNKIFAQGNSERDLHWSVLAFATILYLGISNNLSVLTFGVIALAGALFLYFALSLRIITRETIKISSIFILIVLTLSMVFVNLTYKTPLTPSAELIEQFKSASTLDAKIGILEFENAFRYYANKEPQLIEQEQLMASEALNVDYVILDSDSLYRLFQNRSAVLRFYGVLVEKEVGVFGNGPYRLYAGLGPSPNYDILAEPQPILYDQKSGYKKEIPFSKLVPFNKALPTIDHRNVIINLDSLNEGALYNLIVKCNAVAEGNTTKIYKVC